MENWTPILGYENFYLVSDLGNIKSIKSGRILKQELTHLGYLKISLRNNKTPKKYYVHRLVMSSFLKQEITKEFNVHHIDGDRANNKLLNLEILTVKENLRRKFGRDVKKYKENSFYKRFIKTVELIEERYRVFTTSELTEIIKTLYIT